MQGKKYENKIQAYLDEEDYLMAINQRLDNLAYFLEHNNLDQYQYNYLLKIMEGLDKASDILNEHLTQRVKKKLN